MGPGEFMRGPGRFAMASQSIGGCSFNGHLSSVNVGSATLGVVAHFKAPLRAKWGCPMPQTCVVPELANSLCVDIFTWFLRTRAANLQFARNKGINNADRYGEVL
jgi:hypothetical protein